MAEHLNRRFVKPPLKYNTCRSSENIHPVESSERGFYIHGSEQCVRVCMCCVRVKRSDLLGFVNGFVIC